MLLVDSVTGLFLMIKWPAKSSQNYHIFVKRYTLFRLFAGFLNDNSKIDDSALRRLIFTMGLCYYLESSQGVGNGISQQILGAFHYFCLSIGVL